jgi:peptidoglycan/LPS O-acetylase OafA/YrhL
VTTFVLHYSREMFLFVSALVLAHTHLPRMREDGRLPHTAMACRRRLRAIGLPYLTWTGAYLLLGLVHAAPASALPGQLPGLPKLWLTAVVTGTGWYHLYFLLVTLQYAVVFPSMLRLLHRTRGRHGLLVIASLAIQLLTLWCYHHWTVPSGMWRIVGGDSSLLAYQFWLVAGSVAAMHLQEWHRWVMRRIPVIIAVALVAAAALVWTYLGQLPARDPISASNPLQPVMILWSCAILAVLYPVAVWLSTARSRWLRRLIDRGAQWSFGIYLLHPLALDGVLIVLRRWRLLTASAGSSLLMLAATTLVTVAGCMLLQHTGRGRLLIGLPRPPDESSQPPVRPGGQPTTPCTPDRQRIGDFRASTCETVR